TETYGYDFAVAYRHKVANVGRFTHQFEGQILRWFVLDNSVNRLQGVNFYDLGVYPKFKANLASTWERKGVSAGLNIRFIQGYKECLNNDCNTDENLEMFSRDVDANVTADLFAGYAVKSKVGMTRLTVGVNNLTDQRPPLIYIGFAGDSDASTYDYMGRYFY